MSGLDSFQDGRRGERRSMVEIQIAGRGIGDPKVLEALRAVPRHLFIPPDNQPDAYEDRPVGIGCGQTISQPYIVAVMTEWMAVDAGDRVLEIGTGSGYQTAVLALLAREVVSLERHAALSEHAQHLLRQIGLSNVTCIVGDGSLGWAAGAPYDGILVTAAAPAVPKCLLDQLAEGGRLVAPVGSREEQVLVRVTRREGRFCHDYGIGCRFVPLVGMEGWSIPG